MLFIGILALHLYLNIEVATLSNHYIQIFNCDLIAWNIIVAPDGQMHACFVCIAGARSYCSAILVHTRAVCCEDGAALMHLSCRISALVYINLHMSYGLQTWLRQMDLRFSNRLVRCLLTWQLFTRVSSHVCRPGCRITNKCDFCCNWYHIACRKVSCHSSSWLRKLNQNSNAMIYLVFYVWAGFSLSCHFAVIIKQATPMHLRVSLVMYPSTSYKEE